MKPIYRKAGFEDAGAITVLSFQLGYESTPENLCERLNGILSDRDHCVFVAVAETGIIGWIHGFRALRVESDFYVEIGGMVVDTKYRRKGVGRELIGKIKEWAIQNNIDKLRVRCNVKREEAHVFYKKLGFDEVKEQKIFDVNLI